MCHVVFEWQATDSNHIVLLFCLFFCRVCAKIENRETIAVGHVACALLFQSFDDSNRIEKMDQLSPTRPDRRLFRNRRPRWLMIFFVNSFNFYFYMRNTSNASKDEDISLLTTKYLTTWQNRRRSRDGNGRKARKKSQTNPNENQIEWKRKRKIRKEFLVAGACWRLSNHLLSDRTYEMRKRPVTKA